MIFLILGLTLFLGVHSVRIVADDWRTRTIARTGEKTWKLSYTALSLAGFALIVFGYGQARQGPVVLWETPLWGAKVTGVLMLASMILLSGLHARRSHISVAVHHPMLWSVVIFGVAHLLANNTLPDVLLFGGFGLWAAVDLVKCYARDRANGTAYPAAQTTKTVINLVVGISLWVVIAFWLHLALFGVSPIPRH